MLKGTCHYDKLRPLWIAPLIMALAATCLTLSVTSCRNQMPLPERDVGQGGQESSADSLGPPTPEVLLAAPAPPPFILDDVDLREFEAEELTRMAFGHGRGKDYDKAAQCQYWSVQAADEGRYDVACFEALGGNVDAAIYWLQESARVEGADVRWTSQDSDLTVVREDTRWPKVLNYLITCDRYWRTERQHTVLIVPDGYNSQKELRLIVWLHGKGQHPRSDFARFQRLANEQDLAFVCVSGTISTGKSKFIWADVIEEDYARVEQSLKEARAQVRWKEGNVVALGFSQGAMVAVEISVRHPETFAGAITVSAGTGSPVQLDRASFEEAAPAHQGYVIICGEREVQQSINRSDELERWLVSKNAKVLRPSYPDHADHAFPPDFNQRIADWLTFIDQSQHRNCNQSEHAIGGNRTSIHLLSPLDALE